MRLNRLDRLRRLPVQRHHRDLVQQFAHSLMTTEPTKIVTASQKMKTFVKMPMTKIQRRDTFMAIDALLIVAVMKRDMSGQRGMIFTIPMTAVAILNHS